MWSWLGSWARLRVRVRVQVGSVFDSALGRGWGGLPGLREIEERLHNFTSKSALGVRIRVAFRFITKFSDSSVCSQGRG
jgi:hypothetical protein